VVVSGDEGVPVVQSHPESDTAKAFDRIIDALQERIPAAEGPAGG
jgi:MinD-like ATPase involved in chromosome partitioning or flagellar assembly